MSDQSLPDLLRAHRQTLKLSQQQVATAVRVSRTLVVHWETGRSRPTTAQLWPLFDVLGLTLEQRDEVLQAADKGRN